MPARVYTTWYHVRDHDDDARICLSLIRHDDVRLCVCARVSLDGVNNTTSRTRVRATTRRETKTTPAGPCGFSSDSMTVLLNHTRARIRFRVLGRVSLHNSRTDLLVSVRYFYFWFWFKHDYDHAYENRRARGKTAPFLLATFVTRRSLYYVMISPDLYLVRCVHYLGVFNRHGSLWIIIVFQFPYRFETNYL